MSELNLDTFGEIMDRFLRDNEIDMLLTLPKGTQDVTVEDNVGFGAVVQFYILLNAINPIATAMCKQMGIDRKSDDWAEVVDELLNLVKTELLDED